MLEKISEKVRGKAGIHEDAIDLLKRDHRDVEALFAEYESSDDKRKQGPIVRRLCAALELHAQVEESLVYPAFKKAVPELVPVVNEGIIEHAAVKKLINELSEMHASDEFFDARTRVLKEYVKHHVHEEEHQIFPKVKRSELDLVELADEIRTMKENA